MAEVGWLNGGFLSYFRIEILCMDNELHKAGKEIKLTVSCLVINATPRLPSSFKNQAGQIASSQIHTLQKPKKKFDIKRTHKTQKDSTEKQWCEYMND